MLFTKELTGKLPRFGLVIGLISALFHLAFCIYRRLRSKKENKKQRKVGKMASTFIAGLISSMPLILGLTTSEQKLVKLFMLPVVTCLISSTLQEFN